MGPLAEWRKEREEKLEIKAVRAHAPALAAPCYLSIEVPWVGIAEGRLRVVPGRCVAS